MKLLKSISDLWSTTRFRARDLSNYAELRMVDETRKGLKTMSAVFLGLLLASTLVHRELGLDRSYLYTALALSLLCAHVHLSARAIRETRALHMLGMTLLIVSGTSFVLLAHQQGNFGALLFTSVALLFMVIPMVPWGLREASTVTLLLYGLVSSSTWVVGDRFDGETLWALQAFMGASGMVSLTLVARGASVRKEDLQSRFELENAHREMKRMSLQDPLTGAWNRRYLQAEFAGFLESVRKCGGVAHFAVIDVDNFKRLNDSLGHTYGDQVLQWLCRAVRAEISDPSCLVRCGGDEFVVLLAEEQPEELLLAAAMTLRACAVPPGDGKGAPKISLSVGVVELPGDGAVILEDAYMAADDALYRAKAARRERPEPLHLAWGNT